MTRIKRLDKMLERRVSAIKLARPKGGRGSAISRNELHVFPSVRLINSIGWPMTARSRAAIVFVWLGIFTETTYNYRPIQKLCAQSVSLATFQPNVSGLSLSTVRRLFICTLGDAVRRAFPRFVSPSISSAIVRLDGM